MSSKGLKSARGPLSRRAEGVVQQVESVVVYFHKHVPDPCSPPYSIALDHSYSDRTANTPKIIP
jgi:hypothetical protein